MVSLFISHSSRDNDNVSRLVRELKRAGYHSLFLDFDPVLGIPAGRRWEREIYSRIRGADGVLFCASPDSLSSPWCFAELALARSIDKPVFQLVIRGGGRHPLLEDTQAIDFELDPEVGFQRLVGDLQRNHFGPDVAQWDPERPPYPGLEAFGPSDAAVFFGRDEEAMGIIERLQDPLRRGSGAFLVVFGPSGSGKSSVVRAGVVPRLQRQRQPRRWVIVPPMVPGQFPTANLAKRLRLAFRDRGATRDLTDLELDLSRGSSGLVTLAEQLIGDGDPGAASLLIVVDQGEELVQVAGSHATGEFLDLLGGAVVADSPVSVIVTLRSEFLSSFLEAGSSAAGQPEMVSVAPLHHDRLQGVIEGPALRAGLVFDEGLVHRLVSETAGGDALPLLAYTLRRLYDLVGNDGRITTPMYLATGGVVGALQRRADEVAAWLESQGVGERMLPTLLKLVTVDVDGEPTRRRVRQRDLDAEEGGIVQAFVDARLLVSRTFERDTFVEVVHEALLRQWNPLRDAIERSTLQLRTRTRLERSARDWDAVGRRDAYLLSGDRLAEAYAWRQQNPADADDLPLVAEFLDRSVDQDEEFMRQAVEAVADRVIDGIPGDPELVLLLAMALAEAVGPNPRVEMALNRAIQASPLRAVLRGHAGPVRTVRYSADASRIVTASDDGTARVWDALSLMAVSLCGHHAGGCTTADLTADGAWVVSAGRDGMVRVCDAATGAAASEPIGPLDEITDVAWCGSRSRVVTVSTDGKLRLWDTETATLVDEVSATDQPLTCVTVVPLAGVVVAGTADGEVLLFDEEGLSFRGRGEPHEAPVSRVRPHLDDSFVVTSADAVAVAWADDGAERIRTRHPGRGFSAGEWAPGMTLLLAAHDNGQLELEDTSDDKREPLSLRGHEGLVVDVAWEPAGQYFVTASLDGTVRVWSDQPEKFWMADGRRGVTSVAWSADGGRLATSSRDETVRVWDASSGARLAMLLGFTAAVASVAWHPDGTRLVVTLADGSGSVRSIVGAGAQVVSDPPRLTASAFSADGRWLAVGSDDGRVSLQDGELRGEARPLVGDGGSVGRVAFSPDGSLLAIAHSTGTTEIWAVEDERSPVRVEGHTEAINDIVFSPAGNRLATASDDRSLRLWDLDGTEIERWEFPGAVQRIGWTGGGDGLICLSNGERVDLDLIRRPGAYSTWEPADLTDMTVSSDGSAIAIGHESGFVRVIEAESADEQVGFRAHGGQIRRAAWAADGRSVATATDDAVVRLWQFPGGGTVALLRGHDGVVTDVEFSPDGTVLSASDDGTARLWSPAGEQLVVLRPGDASVQRARFSRDGRWVATTGDAGGISLWSASGSLVRRLAPGEQFREIWWVEGGPVVGVVSGDGDVLCWDARTGERAGGFVAGEVTAAVPCSNGQALLYATADGLLRMGDARTGKDVRGAVDLGPVTAVGCSADGARVGVSFRGDGTVVVLDPATWEAVHDVRSGQDEVVAIRWSPTAPLFLTVAVGGAVRVFEDLSLPDLLRRAQTCSTRSLTAHERDRFHLPLRALIGAGSPVPP